MGGGRVVAETTTPSASDAPPSSLDRGVKTTVAVSGGDAAVARAAGGVAGAAVCVTATADRRPPRHVRTMCDDNRLRAAKLI